MKPFKIGNYDIGKAYRPFIIAEMSGNHNQSLERALDCGSSSQIRSSHAQAANLYF